MAITPAGKNPAPLKLTKKPAAKKKAVRKVASVRRKPPSAPLIKQAATHTPKTKTKTNPTQGRRPGAPSIYSPELAATICDHIANCITLRAIAAMSGMPTVSTIMLWLNGSKPEFSEQYARAREAQADKMADDILSIADEECTIVRGDKHPRNGVEGDVEVVFDATAVARNRLRVDARKWLASKMAPKKYGDKVENTVTGADGGPIQARIAIEFVKAAPRQDD